jgi:hypothetical protein
LFLPVPLSCIRLGFSTTASVQRKHNALGTALVMQFFRNTTREVIEARLPVENGLNF